MQVTLTEKRLCRMWSATSFGGDWFELNKTLWEISQVLLAEGMEAAADDFVLCASIALQRSVDEIKERETKLEVAA